MGRKLPKRVTGSHNSTKRRASAKTCSRLRGLLPPRSHSRRTEQGHPALPASGKQAVSSSEFDFKCALGRSPSSLLLAQCGVRRSPRLCQVMHSDRCSEEQSTEPSSIRLIGSDRCGETPNVSAESPRPKQSANGTLPN